MRMPCERIWLPDIVLYNKWVRASFYKKKIIFLFMCANVNCIYLGWVLEIDLRVGRWTIGFYSLAAVSGKRLTIDKSRACHFELCRKWWVMDLANRQSILTVSNSPKFFELVKICRATDKKNSSIIKRASLQFQTRCCWTLSIFLFISVLDWMTESRTY